MSDELFKTQVKNFLSSEHNEIIAIKGAWGAGKTYGWNKCLNNEKSASRIHLEKYAYVSLYGMSSVEELRRAIFENIRNIYPSQPDELIDKSLLKERLRTYLPGISDFVSETLDNVTLGSIAPILELIKNSATSIGLHDTVICLDDIERRGKALKIGEIFGLVNLLRESRNCRIALIVNEEKLKSQDRDVYQLLNEKTIDRELVFSPSFEEAFDIALDVEKAHISDYVRETARKLDARNIRILIKIIRNAKGISDKLVDIALSPSTTKIIYNALTVQTYCYYSHKLDKNAPSLESFEKPSPDFFNYLNSADEGTKELREFLTDVGYTSRGALEAELAFFVRTGASTHQLIKLIQKREREISSAEFNESLTTRISAIGRRFHPETSNPIQDISRSILDRPADVKLAIASYFLDVADTAGDHALAQVVAKSILSSRPIALLIRERHALRREINRHLEAPLSEHNDVPDEIWNLRNAFAELLEKRSDDPQLIKVCEGAALEDYIELILDTDISFPSDNLVAYGLGFGLTQDNTPGKLPISKKFQEALNVIESRNACNRVPRQFFAIQEDWLRAALQTSDEKVPS